MSRIRSVHPSLFTDEAFMAASAHARLFLIGLWTEADDQGVFEWKPLTLKARILPVDGVDPAALLAEIEAGAFILRFEHDGKSYGAIKNFRRFQRPQKPNEVHPLPENLRIYVGLSASVIVGVTDQSRTSTIKSPQMEDGGCKREEISEAKASVRPKPAKGRISYPSDFDEFWKGYPTDPNMSKSEALGVWKRISAEERQLAIASLPGFRAYCAKDSTYRPVHACRYLAKKRFEGHAAQPPEADAVSRTSWVSGEDPRWPALAARFEVEKGRRLSPMSSKHAEGTGWHFPNEWLTAIEEAA